MTPNPTVTMIDFVSQFHYLFMSDKTTLNSPSNLVLILLDPLFCLVPLDGGLGECRSDSWSKNNARLHTWSNTPLVTSLFPSFCTLTRPKCPYWANYVYFHPNVPVDAFFPEETRCKCCAWRPLGLHYATVAAACKWWVLKNCEHYFSKLKTKMEELKEATPPPALLDF